MRQDGRGSGRAAQGDKGLVQAQAQIDDALQMAAHALLVPGPHAAAFEARLLLGRERSEEHTSELQSPCNLVCRLLLEKKKKNQQYTDHRPTRRLLTDALL